MGFLDKKKNVVGMLILICVVQLGLSLFWGSQKNYLFFDEVFSYMSANHVGNADAEFLENQWMDESWFLNFASVQEENRFQYSIPYGNQITDVHPPLFYIFLHTACSMIPEEFSYWAGMSFNLLFFVCCSVALYFLGKELFGNKMCGLLVAFLYGISYGGINTMVYIRMYMLMTLAALLHSLVYMKYFEQEEIPLKGYIALGITLIGGVLSQYYFLFVAFFYGVWYTLKFLKEKRYQALGKYIAAILGSAAVTLVAWPYILSHLFSGGRGEQARNNLFELRGYFADLKEMFRILNNEMFTKLLVPILAAIVILVALCKKKELRTEKLCIKKMAALLFVCVGYFLIVTKVAPYQVERYVMPIYPLVYLLVVGVFYELIKRIIPSRIALVLCVLGFGGLSIVHMVHSGIPYTYAKNSEYLERRAVTEEYKEHYALYISDNKGAHYYDAVQMLKEYKGFYYVFDLQSVEQTKKDMEILEGEEKLLVYVKDKRTIEEANVFVREVFDGCTLGDTNLIDVDEKWNVYLINLR